MEVQELAPIASSIEMEDRQRTKIQQRNEKPSSSLSPSMQQQQQQQRHNSSSPATAGYFMGYLTLLRSNRPFTLYMCSYITNHLGEWLTYLASLTALHKMHERRGDDDSSSSSSATAIGVLVAVRLLTNVAASPFGGVLADAMDRKQAMIALDLAGAVLAFVFVLAVQLQSPALIYVATFLQEMGSGLYEPSRSAIVPLLCPAEDDLEKATLLTGIAWSVVAAAGSAGGGVLVTLLGLNGCFFVDSATYLLSAILMACVQGDWSVVAPKESDVSSSSDTNTSFSWMSPFVMVREGWSYVSACPWGMLVFMKSSATWLTMDVLIVTLAERVPEQAPLRMGALFAGVGVGCLVGPQLADQWTSLKQPGTVQVAAVGALAIITLALVIMAMLPPEAPLGVLCALQVLRASGVAILWINSSLLLQKLSTPQFLGRVTSMEYAMALGSEAFSALVTGRLRDAAGLSAEQVCGILALSGTLLCIFWSVYTWRGGGAMSYDDASKGRKVVSGNDKHGEELEETKPLNEEEDA